MNEVAKKLPEPLSCLRCNAPGPHYGRDVVVKIKRGDDSYSRVDVPLCFLCDYVPRPS